ncbi:MAG: tRNA-dihydrouridine synthase, partial [Bdellovibrionaceae bacterium]|nr:tRNA-dihydrouridine synthase [Pseudobdellovibrionaceae bacterium]
YLMSHMMNDLLQRIRSSTSSSISSLSADPMIWLAPMEGVVDSVVRDLWTTLGGIDACVTEFIRVTDRLLPDSLFFKDAPELRHGGRTRTGVPVLVQLLGGRPEPMAENAARLAELGALGIDLNFGCPAKTVNRHDGGAALLKDPRRVFDVTSAVRQAVPSHQTVSAKIRLGFSDKSLHLEIARAAEEAGASWLTVHARTRDEGYRPPAHWEYIANIRQTLTIPVIANGEIWSPEDYSRCRQISGCRDVMIGRGLMARPDLALTIKGGRPNLEGHFEAPLAPPLEGSALCRFLEEFAARSLAYRGETYAVCRSKQLLKSLARARPEAAALFESIKRLETHDEIRQHVQAASQNWQNSAES